MNHSGLQVHLVRIETKQSKGIRHWLQSTLYVSVNRQVKIELVQVEYLMRLAVSYSSNHAVGLNTMHNQFGIIIDFVRLHSMRLKQECICKSVHDYCISWWFI